MFMRQVGRTLTAGDEGVLVGHRMLICDRDAKMERARARATEGGVELRRADTVSGAQYECLCGTLRALNQARASEPGDPVR